MGIRQDTRSTGEAPPIPQKTGKGRPRGQRSIAEKMRAPHIQRRMLKAAGDLSAPAQLRFRETLERLAAQLRRALLETGGIIRIEKDHAALWKSVSGQAIGFVDGGLANLPMLGSAPVAARVEGYTVTPGARGAEREKFFVLKRLIDQLYAYDEEGVFEDAFPDVGALRDAARIAIGAAGAVRMLAEQRGPAWVFLRGALVNPVLRFTDAMRDGQVRRRFPDFSDTALADFLPPQEPAREGRGRRFLSVHLRQLQFLEEAQAVVCGVVERESAAVSAYRAVLDGLADAPLRDLFPESPREWKNRFRNAVDPSGEDNLAGRRITDSLLFHCVLEPGEALLPVPVNRNELRRAAERRRDVIGRYPTPRVSYLQVTEWNAPLRLEMFSKDLGRFRETTALVMHCALLLPRHAFPSGMDVAGRVPNRWSRPLDAHAAARAMRQTLQRNDTRLFDALRLMLCASEREFLLRPGVYR